MISLTKKPKNVLKTHKLHLLSSFPSTKPLKPQSPFSFSSKQSQHNFKLHHQQEKSKPITLHKSNHFPYHKQIKSLITTPNIIKKTFSKNNSIIKPKTHLKLSNHKPTSITPNSTMPNTTKTKKPNLTNITYLNTKTTTHHNSVNSSNFISSKQNNKTRLNKLTKVQQKPIITTTNSIEKMICSNSNKQTACSNNSNKNNYDKIFTLLNKEIQEIRDLFKRTTHSVDQQNKIHKIQNEVNNSEIIFDLSLFEKDMSNNEKLIDISQLNNDFDIHYNKNEQSVLFSSYNSELYKNLINGDNENSNKEEVKENKCSEEELLDCINFSSFGSRNVHNNNILKIAQNNIYLNNILLQQCAEDGSYKSEKTECQFGDVVFNQCEHIENNNNVNIFNDNNNGQCAGSNWLDDLEKTEKTYNIFEEKEYVAWVVPIQEIIKKIRENKK